MKIRRGDEECYLRLSPIVHAVDSFCLFVCLFLFGLSLILDGVIWLYYARGIWFWNLFPGIVYVANVTAVIER